MLIIVTVTLALVVSVSLAPLARAATPAELEACFFDNINVARASNGAPALALSSSLSAYGRTHSTSMADATYLFHSEPADVEALLPANWQGWGENVGYATGSEDCEWLFEGFWESPKHQANLLNPVFDAVGIGVIVDVTDTIWTTHVFLQTSASSPTTTTTATAATSTQPPTTTTSATTTTPPATPTTLNDPPTTSTGQAEQTSPDISISPATEEGWKRTTVSRAPGAGAAPDAGHVIDGEPVAAGVDVGCSYGCANTRVYALFLIAIAAVGGAISWWAFRG